MLSFLFYISQSLFIPYSATAESTIKRVNASLMAELPPILSIKIAIGVKPDDQRTKQIEHNFVEMASYYNGKAEFYFTEPISADKLAEESGVKLPCIFVARLGQMIGVYPYPDTDTGFCFLLSLLLDETPKPVSNLTDLFSQLGNTPFTFIAPPEKYDKAISLQFDVSSQMGSIGVVLVEPQLLSYLGFNKSALTLFRVEDMYIVKAYEYPEGLYEQSYPVFRKLISSDLRGELTRVFALIAPDLSEHYQDFLFEVGVANPSFVVGYLPPNLRSYAESICHKVFNDSSVAVVCFNFDNGFYFPTTSEFSDEFLAQPFNLHQWVSRANTLLTKILFGEITPEFLSEAEPQDQPQNNTYKLVGTTYENFVMDPDHDVIVLYKREGCDNCVTFFPQYVEFAQEMANYTTLRFAYIDIVKNSAKKVYPYMAGVPHVHLYPAKNKTNDQPLRGGRSKESLLRLIKMGGSFEYDFEAPPIDKAAVAMELFQILFTAKDMPEEEQIKALKYVEEMNNLLNQTSEPTPEPTPVPDLTTEL